MQMSSSPSLPQGIFRAPTEIQWDAPAEALRATAQRLLAYAQETGSTAYEIEASIHCVIDLISEEELRKILIKIQKSADSQLCVRRNRIIGTSDEVLWFDTDARQDWGGGDTAFTAGLLPRYTSAGGKPLCDANHIGNVVTCWDNRPGGRPPGVDKSRSPLCRLDFLFKVSAS
jgi:hypothetical protein